MGEPPDDAGSTDKIDEALSGVTIESWVDPHGLLCLRLSGAYGSVDGGDLCALADQPSFAALWPAAADSALALVHLPPGWTVDTFTSRGEPVETSTRPGAVIGLVPTASGELVTFELGGTNANDHSFECVKANALRLQCGS